MNFIKTNIDTQNKRDVYRMTKGDSLKVDGIQKGTSLPVESYALYDEDKTRQKQDGSQEDYTQRVLTFVSDGKKYGTISATFIRSFMEIVDIMGSDPFAIIVTGGQSKNGRNFVNCEMDCEWNG